MNVSQSLVVVAAIGAAFSGFSLLAREPVESVDLGGLPIKAQKICPVSGEALGDHGTPIKVNAGEMTFFLCCRDCLQQKITREHWDDMLANMATAQGICPVMKKPLPKHPVSVVVKGRTVFVCCKPCTAKVSTDPDKYLAVVNEQLKKNVGSEK